MRHAGPTPASNDGGSRRRPATIGLTGGIGAGKSAALDAFATLGAAVLSSDEVVHEAYRDPALITQVAGRFGDDVIRRDGTVDRALLAERAFATAAGIRDLEVIVHPRVAAARQAWEEHQRSLVPAPPLLVCEVPLLFEAGLDDQFDAVLVVTAGEDVRRERVLARGQDFAARSGNQIPEAEKIRRADRYLVNDGTIADLERWVQERFEEYRV